MLSYVEEDLEQIAESMREKPKSVRKWLTKLKADYGKNNKNQEEEEDSDWELKQPKEDNDLSYDVKPAAAAASSARRPSRGKWKTRRGRQRSRATIMKMRRGRARRRQPKPSPPIFTPIAESTVEMPHGLLLKLGDVVKIKILSGKSSLAQIQGFLKDQYCDKYVHIRWLLPNPQRPFFNIEWYDPDCYQGGGELTQNISVKHIIAVIRLPPYSHEDRDHEIREVWSQGTKKTINEPSDTLTSVGHRWYNFDFLYCQ